MSRLTDAMLEESNYAGDHRVRALAGRHKFATFDAKLERFTFEVEDCECPACAAAMATDPVRVTLAEGPRRRGTGGYGVGETRLGGINAALLRMPDGTESFAGDEDGYHPCHVVDTVHAEVGWQYPPPHQFSLPSKYAVCDTCSGRGSHVNPSIDASGLTREDFDDDPDFEESYFAGNYDVTCYGCKGLRVVPEPDLEVQDEAAVAAWNRLAGAESDFDAESAAERRMGA